MKKTLCLLLAGFFLLPFVSEFAAAHCEIPCGIYDDPARISMLLEHTTTIEKSMQTILELEKEKHANSNQLIRWVMNKERHADENQKAQKDQVENRIPQKGEEPADISENVENYCGQISYHKDFGKIEVNPYRLSGRAVSEI